MQGVSGKTVIGNAALLATFSLVLSGCLSDEKATSEQQEVEITNHVTGSVGDGPVVGAAMRVVRNDGGVLQEFVSDTFADFDIAVKTRSGNYPLIIEARDGIDLVTGQAPDFTLFGAIPVASENTTANVNPFTTFTVEVAKDLPGGLTAENLAAAERIVVNSMNSGLTGLVATGPSDTAIGASNIAEIVKASEALSETVRRTRNLLQAYGTTTSGNDVIRELSSDLIDDIRDGIGGSRVDARTAAISTVVSVQVLLETMSNELHVNDVDATASMSAAINQVIDPAPTSGIDDQTVTAQMLETVRVGLAAAFAVSGSPKVAELQQVVSGMQAGMDFMLIRTLLPDDYRATLDGVLNTVAGGDILLVNTINGVVRNGGAEPPPNRAPTISGTPATMAATNAMYSFTPTATDADGDLLSFIISGRPTWASFDTSTGRLYGTPGPADAGPHNNIVISVSDGAASASLSAFSIIVNVDNTAPMISGTPPSQLSAGAQYDFTPSASDPDGGVLTFSITNPPAWASFDTSTGRLSGSPGPDDVGAHNNIVISVSDGAASASLPAFSIIVNAVNSVPIISGNPSSQVTAGGQYDFVPAASDADGQTLTFNITNPPVWANFDSTTGRLSGTPTVADVGPHNNIVISVTDGAASAVLPAFSIIVNLDNSAPSISGTPNTQVSVGGLYDFTPSASDPDGNPLTFSITNPPVWASFDTTTGRLSGSPTSGDVGPHNNIVITVTDGAASASLAAFAINVTTTNAAPTIAGSPPAQVVVGSAYDFTPTASDPDGDVLTFSVSNLPSWATFNTATGRLSGTPGSGNTGAHNNIVISVSDGAASASLAAFSIIVNAANSAPTISGNPPTQVTVGNPYNFTPTANDADGDALTFSVTNRPAWASFDAASGNLSGTPGAGDAGSFGNIVINVSDGQASASLPAFTITVDAAPNSPPTISGAPPSQVNANTAYSFIPTASDPDGDSLTFSVTGLPGWASFNTSNGVISGTPTDANVGVYSNISITVTDGADNATLGPFSITVNAVSLGSVTLTWTPPTQNEDGTPLTDLAGYWIYWGTTPGSYPNSVRIDNPGISSYVVENLAPGTYEFVATSFNSAEVQSVYSNPATKVVP
ncbi:MAG: putative Ig domain-containing protein [Gammaproteobacteria bacterium]|nr:putative Ig domain-containing protein [Gammaproteobacteria bacterium]